MANVLLIGATGFVGSAVLNELVSRGHKVTAVVRNIEKLAKSDLVDAVKEDVANVDAIAKLAEGKDAICSWQRETACSPLPSAAFPLVFSASPTSWLQKSPSGK